MPLFNLLRQPTVIGWDMKVKSPSWRNGFLVQVRSYLRYLNGSGHGVDEWDEVANIAVKTGFRGKLVGRPFQSFCVVNNDM